MKKLISVILALLVLAPMVFAGGSSETAAPADGPVSIVWAGWSGEEEATRDIFTKMRTTWEEESGNSVQWVGWTWADTTQQYLIRIQGGEQLDIGQVDSGNIFFTVASTGTLADLNEVSSSIHCQAYYHAINTQKTAARHLDGATEEFHVYALEWTEECVRTYVDGVLLLEYNPDDYPLGRNEDTWPFHKAFGLKLNLAWGGDWGGYKGVDESCLPQTFEIDYVRVFQKNR